MKLRPYLAAFGLLLWAAVPSAPGQTYQGQQLVRAEAVANVNAVVPGESFLVGIRLRMAPNWHTYWRYPGDAGIPTDIQWQLPAGWRVGPIQWPVPLKLNEPGDIQIYGYHDDVLLLQELTPPPDLSGGSIKLSAKVNWLVCEKICVPGDAAPELTLPIAKQNNAANAELFARFQKQLPQSPAANFSATWKADKDGLLLALTNPELAKFSSVEFFPAPAENVPLGHPRLESHAGDKFVFRIPLQGGNFQSLPGVVVFGSSPNATDRSSWDITATAPAAAPANKNSTSLLRFLIFGFIGGLILNLMPCVLPVISLKIFGFIQHAGSERRKILQSGLSFIAGIFVWFVAIALVLIFLKRAGNQIGWSIQFTNSYFVLGLCVIVLVFALNLFGVFEITLPQSANRGLLSASEGSGHAASFFQGLFATILGTSCTAPVLGYAVGFALTQSSVFILLMFLAVAAGMALPYFLLSAQPAWVKFLPKPGAWMERIKQLMGFPMLATLVFLLYILGAQRGMAAIIWTCAFLLLVSLACWMKGAFITAISSFASKVVVFLLMLALVIGGGLYFIGEKFQNSAAPTATAEFGGGWEKFTPDRLAAELQQGHTVFIDFTAAWCITCKFNEATVLETKAVRDAFTQRQIVKLKADWTNGDPAITKLLNQFGRPGVPLYVLYSGGAAQPYIFPELLTKNIVLEKLGTINQTIAANKT